MWLFTKYGFLTAVNARQGDGARNEPADPDKIIIRTRLRSHMENLVARFSEQLGKYPIDEDTEGKRDYRYLLFVPKSVWVEVLAELGQEMDYPKFKPSLVEFDGKKEYHDMLLDIWHKMYQVQLNEKTL